MTIVFETFLIPRFFLNSDIDLETISEDAKSGKTLQVAPFGGGKSGRRRYGAGRNWTRFQNAAAEIDGESVYRRGVGRQ